MLVQKEVKNAYIGEYIPEIYEEYTFLNWAAEQTWWTVQSGSFTIWSQWSNWITAWRWSTNCTMYRDISTWTQFKLQHRCRVNPASRGWWMWCKVHDSSDANKYAWFRYALTTSSGYAGYNMGVIDGVNWTTWQIISTSLSQWFYIDEIVYDGTDCTINLYQDDNGTPWTLLYTYTAAWTNTTDRLSLYHEHATTPYSQTNRIKIWHI